MAKIYIEIGDTRFESIAPDDVMIKIWEYAHRLLYPDKNSSFRATPVVQVSALGLEFSKKVFKTYCGYPTEDGTPCRRYPVTGSEYCYVHTETRRCGYPTKAGKPCNRIPALGETHCIWHKPKPEPEPEDLDIPLTEPDPEDFICPIEGCTRKAPFRSIDHLEQHIIRRHPNIRFKISGVGLSKLKIKKTPIV